MTEGIEDDGMLWTSKGGRGDRLSRSGGVGGDSQGVQEVGITGLPLALWQYSSYMDTIHARNYENG